MEADEHNRLWAPRAAVALVADTTQPRLSIEADRAARVLMRKSPETQRTYQGIYARFAGWLAERDGIAEASTGAFTAEAFVAYLDEREAVAAPSTIKKERAALRKLAKYLHQLGLIDATVILMVDIPTVTDTAPARQGLDKDAWERVLAHAREARRLRPVAVLAADRRTGSRADRGARRRRAALRGGPHAARRPVRPRVTGKVGETQKLLLTQPSRLRSSSSSTARSPTSSPTPR